MAFLNHIGIAVRSLPEVRGLFSLLGLEVSHHESVVEQGVKAHFIPLPPETCHLELLEVTDPDGTVANFMAKRGPGIHHLSFELKSGELLSVSEKLRSAGYRLIYESPRSGAHGMIINFVHPSCAGGLLIELMEKAKK